MILVLLPKWHVAVYPVGEYIGCRPSRARPHHQHTQRRNVLQLERMRQPERHQGQHYELWHHSNGNSSGPPQMFQKGVYLYSTAHSKHDDDECNFYNNVKCKFERRRALSHRCNGYIVIRDVGSGEVDRDRRVTKQIIIWHIHLKENR